MAEIVPGVAEVKLSDLAEAKKEAQIVTMVLHRFKMPLAVDVKPNTDSFQLDPLLTAFYSFIGSPIQLMECGDRHYAVPARQLKIAHEYMNTHPLPKQDLTEIISVVDAPLYAAIPKIQPRVSNELATIYEAFGIPVVTLKCYGQSCTVLISEINNLVDSGALGGPKTTGRMPVTKSKVLLRSIAVAMQNGVLPPLARLLFPLMSL